MNNKNILNIENKVVKKMINSGLTISLAESCTGGYISKKITDVAGSSKVFRGSIIAYDNDIKERFLDIPKTMLENFGAVSKEVVSLMALNIKNKFNTHIGLSVSGLSGPGGGTKERPIGLVYIGIVYKDKDILVEKFNLTPNRKEHRRSTMVKALHMLSEMISKYT